MIVTPDASVLLKWVLPSDDEQDGDTALSLRDEALVGTVEAVSPFTNYLRRTGISPGVASAPSSCQFEFSM